MSQKNKILEHLRKDNSITTASAVDLFKIYRLSERIREIEKDGHVILKETETTSGGARIVRYWLCGIEEVPRPKRPRAAQPGGDLFPNRTNEQYSEYDS